VSIGLAVAVDRGQRVAIAIVVEDRQSQRVGLDVDQTQRADLEIRRQCGHIFDANDRIHGVVAHIEVFVKRVGDFYVIHKH